MCLMHCNPICGGCPTKVFHVVCNQCHSIVKGGNIEKCSKCGAELPKRLQYCEVYDIECNMPCRTGRDKAMKGKNIPCRKFGLGLSATANTDRATAAAALRAAMATATSGQITTIQ